MTDDADDQSKSPRHSGDKILPIDKDFPVIPNRESMTLIPWKDIWSSLKIAKHRGDGEMIEVFYDTLFKEAVFDDNGAWAWDFNKRE